MSDTQDTTNGNDLETVSQIPSKYDAYYKASGDGSEDLGGSKEESSETVVDVEGVKTEAPTPKAETKVDESQPKKSGYERRIGVLTNRNKMLEDRLAKLEAAQNQKPEKVLTRENFLTDAEYGAYKDEQLEKRILGKVQPQQQAPQDDGFKRSWNEKVNSTLNEDERGELFDLIGAYKDDPAFQIHEDLNEFFAHSPVGARAMLDLLNRPAVLQEINNMPAYQRYDALRTIEQGLTARTQKVPQPAKPVVSKAPSPIGTIGNTGMPAGIDTDQENDPRQVQSYYMKRYGPKK